MLARYISEPLEKETLQARLESALARLKALDVSIRVFLFGSAARNEMDRFSDIDFYVIFRNSDELKKSSRFLYTASIELGFAIDWILTTEDDHKRRALIGGLAYDIERDGQLFFESKDEFKKR